MLGMEFMDANHIEIFFCFRPQNRPVYFTFAVQQKQNTKRQAKSVELNERPMPRPPQFERGGPGT